MTEESKTSLRAAKVANVILALSELYNLTIQEAADLYYRSVFAGMMEDGIADLQCRSDKYLATLIWEEAQEK